MHLKGTAYVAKAGDGSAVIEVTGADGKVERVTAQRSSCWYARGTRSRAAGDEGRLEDPMLSSREAMILKEIPKKLSDHQLAGPIGVEFAYIYGEFGTQIVMIEMMDRILPVEDEEVSARLETLFKKRGMDIRTKTKTEKVEATGTGVKVTVVPAARGRRRVIEADKALVAMGVTGNVEGVFARECMPEVVKGHIKVGKDFQTSVKGIYAAGDVIGPPWLAHVATMEAKIAVERMFGASTRENGLWAGAGVHVLCAAGGECGVDGEAV